MRISPDDAATTVVTGAYSWHSCDSDTGGAGTRGTTALQYTAGGRIFGAPQIVLDGKQKLGTGEAEALYWTWLLKLGGVPAVRKLVALLETRAFERGAADARAEIREALGIKNPAFGGRSGSNP